MKNLFLLTSIMVLLLTACGQNPQPPKEPDTQTEMDTQIETEAETQPPVMMETVNIYHADADFMELITTPAEFQTITAEGLLEKILEYNGYPKDIKVLSMSESTVESKMVISLDLSEEYGNYIKTMGTSGEFFAIQSVVNTFVEVYGADGVMLTVEGNILETGHNVYNTMITFAK